MMNKTFKELFEALKKQQYERIDTMIMTIIAGEFSFSSEITIEDVDSDTDCLNINATINIPFTDDITYDYDPYTGNKTYVIKYENVTVEITI